jgi:toxin ParE1/3/4
LKPVVLLPAAEQDLLERTNAYSQAGGATLAERFFDAAVAATRAFEQMPGIGDLQMGELCGVPGLRGWRIKGFPAHWFYFERSEHVDVVRLLADAQDLIALLGSES